MAGIEACPVSHPLLRFALEGAKRRFARLVQPKEPLSVSTVQVIATHFASNASLSDLRFLFILLVGFAGFFRIDEIRNKALRDVSIRTDHMSVYVPQRKNDQYREGHTALVARIGKVTCPVAVTELLIKLLPQSSSAFPLVCRIVKARSKEYFHSSLGVSVSTLREEFKKHIKPFVSDTSKYGTHSVKSGAVSNPACRKIAGDLIDIHTGWRCESTKHKYIKHGLSERLAVSKELSI
ncbi:integrase/recombinase xerD homolog [Montipora foliosa]|uniref:integrase/recombinase xerD homolog n=1 Tax=Montipora foliosa TaxID=591990 RepID=UPI0035F1189B